jgi:hypothetical protein
MAIRSATGCRGALSDADGALSEALKSNSTLRELR